METELKQPPPPSVLQGAASYVNDGELINHERRHAFFRRDEHHSRRWTVKSAAVVEERGVRVVLEGNGAQCRVAYSWLVQRLVQLPWPVFLCVDAWPGN